MKIENKFFVINMKRAEELNDATRVDGCNCRSANECYCGGFFGNTAAESSTLQEAIDNFIKAYEERIGKYPDNKYWVVNQDEPYANEVFKLIEKGEDSKE